MKRQLTKDPTIERLVTINGRPIRKVCHFYLLFFLVKTTPQFADLPSRFVALNGIEHFYFPFLGPEAEHDVSGLTDRPIRMFDRSGGYQRPRVLVRHYIPRLLEI